MSESMTKVSRRSSQEIGVIRDRDLILPLKPLVPEDRFNKDAAAFAMWVGTFDGGE